MTLPSITGIKSTYFSEKEEKLPTITTKRNKNRTKSDIDHTSNDTIFTDTKTSKPVDQNILT